MLHARLGILTVLADQPRKQDIWDWGMLQVIIAKHNTNPAYTSIPRMGCPLFPLLSTSSGLSGPTPTPWGTVGDLTCTPLFAVFEPTLEGDLSIPPAVG